MTNIIQHRIPIVTPKKTIELEEREETNDPILEALLEHNVQALSSYLNNLEAQIEEEHISTALEINFSLLKILLSHHTAKVTKDIILNALENPETLALLLSHHTAKVTKDIILNALENPETLELLLSHHTAKVTKDIIYEALENPKTLELLLSHNTAKVEDWMINTYYIKDPNSLNILKKHLNDKLNNSIDASFAEYNITDSSEELIKDIVPVIGADNPEES